MHQFAASRRRNHRHAEGDVPVGVEVGSLASDSTPCLPIVVDLGSTLTRRGSRRSSPKQSACVEKVEEPPARSVCRSRERFDLLSGFQHDCRQYVRRPVG